jgi:hypothetical protein
VGGTESMRKGFLQYLASNVAARNIEGSQNMLVEKIILAHDYRAASSTRTPTSK